MRPADPIEKMGECSDGAGPKAEKGKRGIKKGTMEGDEGIHERKKVSGRLQETIPR
jgi:hypothetical protein